MFIQEQTGCRGALVKFILWIGFLKLDNNLDAIFKRVFSNIYFLHEESCGCLGRKASLLNTTWIIISRTSLSYCYPYLKQC